MRSRAVIDVQQLECSPSPRRRSKVAANRPCRAGVRGALRPRIAGQTLSPLDADARRRSINPGRASSMTLAVTRGDHERQGLMLEGRAERRRSFPRSAPRETRWSDRLGSAPCPRSGTCPTPANRAVLPAYRGLPAPPRSLGVPLRCAPVGRTPPGGSSGAPADEPPVQLEA